MAKNVRPAPTGGDWARGPAGSWAGRLFGAALALVLVLLLLALTGRLLFSLVATAITTAILHAISHFKRKLVDEPLTFADFALLRHAIRHPKLYYANFLWSPPGLAAIAFTLTLIVVWLWIEPPLFAAYEAVTRVLALAVAIGMLVVAFKPVPIAPLDSLLARLAPGPDLDVDLARFGLLGSLAVHVMRWRRDPAPALPIAPIAAGPDAPEVVIVVQIESFADPRSWDGEAVPLPNLEAAKGRAVIEGPLAPLGHGAYTMRPEFEILTGISIDEVGFDRFNPYLRAERFAAAALPNRLAAAGYQTVFIHPHDPEFFRRDEVMPAFGFERLIDDSHFAASDRSGRYVGDSGVSRRILAEVTASTTPILVFAVTMENHGPWSGAPGVTPWQQYASGLTNSDRMIGDLIAGLDQLGRRALLMFYGDHAPIMKDISSRVPTPFAVLTWPPAAARTSVTVPYGPAKLHASVVKIIEGGAA